MEAGAQHNSRDALLPPVPAAECGLSPQVVPTPSATSAAAVASPAGLLASSGEEQPASAGTVSGSGGLLSAGQPPPATLGKLPFRQGWAHFGRVTAASLADEQPSASFFMDPQPPGVLPACMEGVSLYPFICSASLSRFKVCGWPAQNSEHGVAMRAKPLFVPKC